MAKLDGVHRKVGYKLRWVQPTAKDVLWDAVLGQGGQTVGWPSGRLPVGSADGSLVPIMVRLAVEDHIEAALDCLKSAPG